MKKRLIVCFVGLLSLFSFSAFIVDEDPFTELLKKLEEFTKKFPQEKIHLHLDKPYYAIGDDIWFKAYVIDSRDQKPTAISNIIYVELINEKDSIQKQLKLSMKGGIAWGDFKLTDSLNEGNYRIRAYTQWMRNAGSAFFFDKTIKIGNSWANKVFTKTSSQFTTENLIEKVSTTIQFTNKDGKPYTNSEVNYEIQLNTNKSSKAKTTTNANGEIKIPIINTQPNLSKSGKILATITMPDGQKVVKNIPIKTTSNAVDVQFFPEGGNLIAGLPCKIAIKAINTNGLGENVNGVIIDNDGTEISSFETVYLGMGTLSLTPNEGKTYSAKIKFANGTEKTINLPKVEPSGYALAVNNTDTSKMAIKIMMSPNLLNQGDLNLIAQHNGTIFFATKVSTAKQIATVVVPKINFPSGIVQITLFSPNNTPVSERVAFANNAADKIDIDLQNLKSSYGKKSNMDLTLVASNNSKITQGSFSVAVTNSSVVIPDIENESNILTSLLLTSDLTGYIEKPNHYFSNNDLKTHIELDNLLLTQGWRKIDWKAINNPSIQTPTYPAEKSMKISGLVTTNNKKPVANGKITLLSTTKGMVMANTTSDENGHFSFDGVSFGDSIKFVLQGSTKEGKKDVRIVLDKFQQQSIGANTNNGDIETNVNTSILKYLTESDNYFEEQYKKGFLNRTNQLKTVNIVQKVTKEDKASPNSSNLNGRGRANYVVTEEDLKNTLSLAQYFQGRVPGVAVSTEEDTRGQPILTKGRFEAAPIMAVSLDGIVLRDFSLDNIEVSEVESIEVITDVALSVIYGVDGYNGILIITTKRGKGKKMSEISAPGITIFTPKGYDIVRQFYSPKYDVKQDDKPDFRPTVYWNPHVVSDATGKATLNYYNTDQTGTYRIVIEGIDADGNLARKVITYQVN
ncbi:TonB-dependent receptor plug domain-containing protein [Pedobacter sp. LMG 31464]|uniref:TonB-dependent receptor plug domain-containing protein n=1 Tax=Pedobacter planticolens TaxID=2679964 RepID=A0A923E0R2_9SPHI|nr:carboxypeptidase-like regulatory domain-containing protein [Pedobacter planticolens]MBB2146575.1 TonB-dependent receptor plug domain-containing protein [Pedobacter planticolens]